MICIVCFKELEEGDLCPECREFFEVQYRDPRQREAILEYFRKNAGPDL